MQEVRTEVTPVKITAHCDCNEGSMVATGVALLSAHPQYEHRCTVCKYIETYSKKYPYIDYIERQL